MPDQIKPGKMGNALPAHLVPAEFANSMAAEIEAQLVALLRAEGLSAPRTDDNSRESRERRLLFVAIARGIVKHLEQHRGAIQVDVTAGSGTRSPTFDIDGKDW